MKKVIHPATSRGYADHGWLQTHHTFSFARYYDPSRINFGALRVINDDTVAGGEGFGMHPHDNMEIVSIPLEGELRHGDSMGNGFVLREGQIQVMSAGGGITHSEFNNRPDRPVKFLQIWVFPDRNGHTPRYENLTLMPARPGELRTLVTPEDKQERGASWVHQQAWFHTLDLEPGASYDYEIRRRGNGLYVFVLEGKVSVGGEHLSARDGIGVWETASVAFSARAKEGTKLLLIEVPM
jgi:redox-sensitive bicupin YhaK (pirin superfamily)